MNAPATGQTVPEREDLTFQRREQRGRWATVAALVAFLIAATFGAFGVRSGETSASGNGYDVTVRYGRITRPGLATPWSLEIRRPDGSPFPGRVTVESDAAYFAMFDENSLDPEPSSASSDGDRVTWIFDPPAGAVLEISLDARVEPGVQWGKTGRTRLIDGDGAAMVAVSYKTTVMP